MKTTTSITIDTDILSAFKKSVSNVSNELNEYMKTYLKNYKENEEETIKENIKQIQNKKKELDGVEAALNNKLNLIETNKQQKIKEDKEKVLYEV